MSEKVLVYTIHKAGSLFLHRLNEAIASALDVGFYSINNESQAGLIGDGSWNRLIEDSATGPACFGPIRSQEAEPNIPSDLDPYEVILHARDPRDVLVSLFYYHVFSRPNEPVPQTHEAAQIERWREMGIDAVVLEWADHQRGKYRELTDRLLGKGAVNVVRYEDMVERFERWLASYLASFAGLIAASPNGVSIEALRENLYRQFKNEFLPPEKEDVFAHKRQITPGDHRRKLRLETIAQLDERLEDVLKALGYASETKTKAVEEGIK